MSKLLSWGLIIATYEREKILPLCLELAIAQTRKPSEIIIIDASRSWETNRDLIMTEIAPKCPGIRWLYTFADVPSLTMQRNQGLCLATTDVVFLLDDDSLMYPTCAEEIMKVYEADVEGVVKAVATDDADAPPSGMVIPVAKRQTGYSDRWLPILNSSLKFLWKHVLMMHIEVLWIPYDGSFPKHSLPSSLKELNVVSMPICKGYQMTFRRDVFTEEMFEPLLRYYCAGEDLDACNRITRHGPLVLAQDAKLHHFNSAGGRLPRFRGTVLGALNQVLFLKKHSSDLRRDRARYYHLILRRIFAELIKDTLSRRWSMPQVRGLIVALWYSRKLFSMSKMELAEWYPRFQQELVESGHLISTENHHINGTGMERA
ncbi:MAG: glycosyltransferase [Leptolyngbyaceae cyanobacterium RU_5_1]|nr:glycosyltransferase [Leptolyngbyaceae cyanobacterium RU_5_1]